MGEKDLILLLRDKDENEWTEEKNLNCFGDLPDPEWFKTWPLKAMPVVTSPAKGRQQKKKVVHDISRNSDKENTPKKPKKSDVTSISQYFERRDKLRNKSKS